MTQDSSLRSGFADIEGARLYYETAGAGEPLLLIHAGVADSRMWDAQWQAFAAHYRVIRFDMRGFGETAVTAGGTFASYEDVAALLRFLAIESTIVVGVSFGGLVALDFTLAYPKMVRALVLGAANISGEPASEALKQVWRVEEALLEVGDIDGATELNVRTWVDGPHRTPDQVDPAVREQVRLMQRNAFTITLPDDLDEQQLDPHAVDRLAEIKLPTLVLAGDLDLPTFVDLSARLAAAIPGAQYEVISGVAHMLSMEQPAVFNRLVLDFLAQAKV